MHGHLSAVLLFLTFFGYSSAFPTQQQPLIATSAATGKSELLDSSVKSRGLRGKFLHITGTLLPHNLLIRVVAYCFIDLHPDPFYKYHSSTEQDSACHRGQGPAGAWGAETSDCDSPISLINATFKWIDENLKDTIDFVVWTGDSARHDNDEGIPRTDQQIVELNELLVTKFVEVFGKNDDINDTDPTNDFTIPIVPTFGNNDILPHNILDPGPNRWTKNYLSIWRKFIPEAQRHGFSRGGWFFVEVIPKKLAVFSLNTLYFFDSNTAVDGCAKPSEPGYEQMEWLRIQLQFLRERGLKAIMTGHVPPARTDSKLSWDETCWQKYTLWMKQYRDVVVGALYGHMNVDHFMLQDSKDIDIKVLNGIEDALSRTAFDEDFTTQSSADYLTELREEWSKFPDPPKAKKNVATIMDSIDKIVEQHKKNGKKSKKHKKSKQEKFFDKIGGQWAERYSATLVGPSVVPNYFPTLRVFEYNITGLASKASPEFPESEALGTQEPDFFDPGHELYEIVTEGKNRKTSPKKPKQPLPLPPSKSSPPGPAYSPQPLTLLSYTQYYANLTYINDDFVSNALPASPSFNPATLDDTVDAERWHKGKHSGKNPKKGKEEREHDRFEYEVEYDTKTDKVYGLKDLTVRSYIDLAARIGRYKSSGSQLDFCLESQKEAEDGEEVEVTKNKKKHKKHKATNKVWFTFVRRAFVGSKDEDELRDEFS